MATREIYLTVLMYILALPLIVISHFLILLKFPRFNNDLKHCIIEVESAPSLPDIFVTTLIAAEDHRNAIHPGIDPIAIIRVLVVWVRTGKFQGASTIEQQLVRVVLGRYEKTLWRKYREQILAIALSYNCAKRKIAMAYLSKAFYGSGKYGVLAFKGYYGVELKNVAQVSVSKIIARLKYPEPLVSSNEWSYKIHRRVQYIEGRLLKLNVDK